MTDGQPYPIGTVVTARPWVDGYELDARSGITIGGLSDREYTAVWFHTLGELDRDEDGHAIQAILTSKINITGTLADWAPSTLKRLARRVQHHLHSSDVYVLNAISTAYRASTRAAEAPPLDEPSR